MSSIWRVIALATLASTGGCGSDEPTGVERPIDGSWEFLGIYTDLEGIVRCWLTAEATITPLGGGVNTVVGSGSHTLDCLVNGTPEVAEGSTTIQNGRLQGRDLTIAFGACGFIGTYQPTRPDFMKGHGTCNVALPQVATVGLIGSWQAERVGAP